MDNLPHILLPKCPMLKDRADTLHRFAVISLSKSEKANAIFNSIYNGKDDNKIVQLLLDPSVVPEIIAAKQSEPDILQLMLSVTTTWCYALNRTRSKLLGM